jgi:ubiquinol-cytochrome c reductase iron-sulfur subunit
MMSEDTVDDSQRRDFLGKFTAVVGGVGAAVACWPFIKSMAPAADVLTKATTEVDLSSIPVGEEKIVPWQGKPVFIIHRTPEQIAAMEASPGGKDPEPDAKRVQQPEWLVVIGICTHLGCVPGRSKDGWLCPCHGSRYDLSGRILKGPAPRNLELPPYQFIAADKLLIGKA